MKRFHALLAAALIASVPAIAQTPAPRPAIILTVDASNPSWDSGAPLSSNLLPNVRVRLYGALQGEAKRQLGEQAWVALARFRRESTSTAVHCFDATLTLDTNGDGVADEESPHTAEWCGTFSDAPAVLHLAPPNGITGERAPAAQQ